MSLTDLRMHLGSVDLEPDWAVITDQADTVSLDNLTFSGPRRRLQQSLMESDWVENLMK
jgi:hypothetical protein